MAGLGEVDAGDVFGAMTTAKDRTMVCRLQVLFEGADPVPRSCPRCGLSGTCQKGYSQLKHSEGGFSVIAPDGGERRVKPWDKSQLPEGTGEGPKADIPERPITAEQAIKDFFRDSADHTYKVTIASANEDAPDFVRNNLNIAEVIPLLEWYLAVKNKRRAHVFSVTPELPD